MDFINLKDECATFPRHDASTEPIKHQFPHHLDVDGLHLTRLCRVNNERRQKKPLSVAPSVISPAFGNELRSETPPETAVFHYSRAGGQRISPANAHRGRLTTEIRFSV